MTKVAVVKLMKSCKCQQDWRDACDKVSKDGIFPKYWWKMFIESGLQYEIVTSWEKVQRR